MSAWILRLLRPLAPMGIALLALWALLRERAARTRAEQRTEAAEGTARAAQDAARTGADLAGAPDGELDRRLRPPGLRHLPLLLALLPLACAAPPADTLCVATRPIYLEEGAIAALAPHRPARLAIATHNAVWEQRCLP